MKRIFSSVATLGPIGYLVAPGTMGTLVTIPLVFYTHSLISNQISYGFFLIVSLWVAFIVISHALDDFPKSKDPQQIILDELVGCLITFWAIPLSIASIAIGFSVFRILDILKIGYISSVEKMPRAWGIICDDALAALMTNILLRIIFT